MCRSVAVGAVMAQEASDAAGLWITQRTTTGSGAFLVGVEKLTVPGYDAEALLGRGAHGEVWRARETATGDVVPLKRVRVGDEPPARDRLRREAALLGALAHDHVVRLRRVVGDAESAVLVLDYAAGGSLAGVLAERSRLEPGEVVTTAAPLAGALAVAH